MAKVLQTGNLWVYTGQFTLTEIPCSCHFCQKDNIVSVRLTAAAVDMYLLTMVDYFDDFLALTFAEKSHVSPEFIFREMFQLYIKK